jgi:hypothetical protein
MGDPAGVLEFVAEPLEDPFFGSDFRLEELDGDFFVDFSIQYPQDFSHPALAELFNDLVASGETAASGQIADIDFHAFRVRPRGFLLSLPDGNFKIEG